MHLFRSAAIAGALFASLQASAAINTYSTSGILENVDPAVAATYAVNTSMSAVFSIDGSIAGNSYSSGVHDYAGAFSGTLTIGGNVISFSDSYASLYAAPWGTSITLLGGNGWGTGGTIHESQPTSGLSLNGIELRFDYAPGIPQDTPIRNLLSGPAPLSTIFYLDYQTADAQWTSSWGELSGVSPVPEPDSGVMLLAGGAVLLLARRRKS